MVATAPRSSHCNNCYPCLSFTEASPQHPFLGLAFEIDISLIGKLLLEFKELDYRPMENLVKKQPAIYAYPIDDELTMAFVRFMRLLESPVDLKILGPGVEK